MINIYSKIVQLSLNKTKGKKILLKYSKKAITFEKPQRPSWSEKKAAHFKNKLSNLLNTFLMYLNVQFFIQK